jgi:hypothetical protein
MHAYHRIFNHRLACHIHEIYNSFPPRVVCYWLVMLHALSYPFRRHADANVCGRLGLRETGSVTPIVRHCECRSYKDYRTPAYEDAILAAVEREPWNENRGTRTVEREPWNESRGTRTVEREPWNENRGTRTVELTRYRTTIGTTPFEGPRRTSPRSIPSMPQLVDRKSVSRRSFSAHIVLRRATT